MGGLMGKWAWGSFLALSVLSSGSGWGATRWGKSVAVGGGAAALYVVVDRVQRPTEIGVALTERALTGLPQGNQEFLLPFPVGVRVPPYRHVVLNWNPRGHIPPHIYDLPHF